MPVRVFTHPLRLDGTGSVTTVEQWTDMQAQQLGVAAVATVLGERELAPDFGMPDPIAAGLETEAVAAAVDTADPDLVLESVTITGPVNNRQIGMLSVGWKPDADDDGGDDGWM